MAEAEEMKTGRREWLAEPKVSLKTGQCHLSQSDQASTPVLRPHAKDKEQEGGKKDKKLRLASGSSRRKEQFTALSSCSGLNVAISSSN